MNLVETEIGTIAPDWKIVSLKDVAEKPQYGLTAKAAKTGDTKLLRITDITEQGVNWTTVPYCSATMKKIDMCRLKSGDIVFVRIGATTGKSYMINDPPDAVFASYLIRVRAGKDLEPGFLIQFFQSRGYWQQVDANKHANLKKGVNGSILSELLLPLPQLHEQKKIAHILSTVQRSIEAQERIIQTTTELKKALMHKLFTEGLRNEPQKQTEIGPVPECWEVVELGSLAKIGNGSTPKRANTAYWEAGTIPWLNSTKIHDGFITEADQFVTPQAVKECHLPKVAPNSLLIAITGQGKTLGNSAITRIETCINQHLAYAQFHSEKIDPDFVLWYTQTRYEYLRSIAHGGGSTKGALTCGFLKTLLIPVPSTGEQEEIVNVFQTLEEKQHCAASKLSALQSLFRTMLHKLMTAKIRINQIALDKSRSAK